LYAGADLASLGVYIESIKQGKSLTLLQIQQYLDNAKANGRQELAAGLLSNYVSVASKISEKETKITDIVNLLVDVFESIVAKYVTAKSLSFYVAVCE
jgi:hypothetical protein